MYQLSGFGDEIGPDLQEQIHVMAGEGIRYLELRGAWNKNVLDLDKQQLSDARDLLRQAGFGVSSIASPIGKIRITEDFSPHFDQFTHAVALAHFFGSRYVRIFSYYPPEGEDIRRYRDEVMKRMEQKARYAEKEHITLLNENELDIYGESPEGCADIIATVNSPALRTCFDPANFIMVGIKPFDHAYPLLRDSIEYFHIKDAFPRGTPGRPETCVVAGEGEGQIRETLSDFAVFSRDRNTFLSLEPHLANAGQFAGFSGPDKFIAAARALKKILAAL